MSNITNHIDDLVERLTAIPALNGVVVPCYDPDDLAAQVSIAPPPWCGVVYESMRSFPEVGATEKKGLSSYASFGLYLVVGAPEVGSVDMKRYAINFLDDMRQAILGQPTPGARKYQFLYEGLADSKKGRAVWVQRWLTPIINIPGRPV